MNEQVLVIDDEQDSVDSICDLLTVADISCRGETDAAKAIESFHANPTDIVVVDYLLNGTAGITGLDVVAKLKDIKPFTRFVMISGWMRGEGDENERANKMKVAHFLRKPFDATELVSVVDELLKNIEAKANDWRAMAEEYVSVRKVSAEEVRAVNEEFKLEIIQAFERQESND
ncbi:MAG TPA: response regulator [Pyrinomonadaceae bacterium]|nr:response regulator [Pyrinomonadaceae bacterium]